MKKVISLVICVFAYSFTIGQNYQTIYSCSFEQGEDVTNWNLETDKINESYVDYFHIDALENTYSGEKCLFVSDNGVTNTVTLSNFKNSTATLDINLSAGNYILSFVYKNPVWQQILSCVIFSDMPLQNSEYNHSELQFQLSSDWTYKEISFNVPVGQQANYIQFISTLATGTGQIESAAIDSIVLKREIHNIEVNVLNGNGTVTPSQTTATAGTTITLDVVPDSGYKLLYLIGSKAGGGSLTITDNQFVMPADNVIIVAVFTALQTYTVSGTVTINEQPLENVEISYLNTSIFTDENGYYSFGVFENEDVTITPSLQGYTFLPTDTTINDVLQNIENVDFVANIVVISTYTISGTVTANGSPLENVEISYLNTSTFTDENGYYSFEVIENEDVTITPSLQGYTFIPADSTINNVLQNIENVNFAANTTGINEVAIQELNFYPNPAKDELQVTGYQLQGKDYTIFSVTGQIFMQGILSDKTINVKSLQSGMYFIKIGNTTGKFIKE